MDATTYMVDKQYPLRLSRELVEPKGKILDSGNIGFETNKELRLPSWIELSQRGLPKTLIQEVGK